MKRILLVACLLVACTDNPTSLTAIEESVNAAKPAPLPPSSPQPSPEPPLVVLGELKRNGDFANATIIDSKGKDTIIVAYDTTLGLDRQRDPVCTNELDMELPCGKPLQVDFLWGETCDDAPHANSINAHHIVQNEAGRGQFFFVDKPIVCEPGKPRCVGEECIPFCERFPNDPKCNTCGQSAGGFSGGGSWRAVSASCSGKQRADVSSIPWSFSSGTFEGQIQIFWVNGNSTTIKERLYVNECGPASGTITWRNQSHCHNCSEGHVNSNAQYFLRFVDKNGSILKSIELSREVGSCQTG